MGRAMAFQVEAIYENGILRPVQPLPLAEHERVQLTVDQAPAAAVAARIDLAQWFGSIESHSGLIDAPKDWAARHDDYLHGPSDGQ
jgi:predicted DNA-binding antitoxin AbrB/MazE fold protein